MRLSWIHGSQDHLKESNKRNIYMTQGWSVIALFLVGTVHELFYLSHAEAENQTQQTECTAAVQRDTDRTVSVPVTHRSTVQQDGDRTVSVPLTHHSNDYVSV